MRYYDSRTIEKLQCGKHEALQRYFPDNYVWGGNVLFGINKELENVEICKLSDVTVRSATWTHYANICCFSDGIWEVNTQFNGDNKDEMWIYKYFTSFANACRFVASGKFLNMKPIKKY